MASIASPQSISILFHGGRTPKKNSMERKKIIVDLPFPCRETHCPHCENSDVYVRAIADLRFGRRPHQLSRD